MFFRRTATLLSCAVTALLLAAGSSSAAPAPKVDGNRLVDTTTGRTFVPRGVNWPSFEYACHYGYGTSNTASATSVGPTDEQARLIASWHTNVVRLPLNQDCWLGDDGEPTGGITPQAYQDAVAAWVGKLHAAGLAVILDLHWSGPDGVQADGQRMMADERSPVFWSSVAQRFKDDPSVLFDAFNEPFSQDLGDGTSLTLDWGCWRDGGCPGARQNENAQAFDKRTFLIVGMQPLVGAIRAAGARQPILLGGLDYANDLRGWLDHRPDDDQLVAAFHNYGGQRCNTQACWDAEIAPVAAKVPVVTGEFGETDCKEDHDRRYMSWADAHGVGYVAWQWVVLQPDEQANPACSGLALIKDVEGTPNAPNGTALKSHLDALAGGAAGDRRAPKVTRVRLGRTRRVMTVRLKLDEAATVRATLTRRGGSSTVVTRQLAKGTRTITLLKRRPARGRYRVSLRATDAAGNRSAAVGASLRVR
ncbi:glycoside hydrolase family 5 protein [Patulibacter minatonensis]|uniref:glycoside hydrolase family 5 protein n=1 Tax=Patulibacter minatonensis TaxID=298163 RepID=UPI0006856CA0|nr:cellulase family glycosylhydrolase [Patulibacter minatonensis]